VKEIKRRKTKKKQQEREKERDRAPTPPSTSCRKSEGKEHVLREARWAARGGRDSNSSVFLLRCDTDWDSLHQKEPSIEAMENSRGNPLDPIQNMQKKGKRVKKRGMNKWGKQNH